MIIVKQEAHMVECTDNPAQVIEAMGRLCYRSEKKADSSLEFVRMLLRRGHLSVLEHASATFVMTTNRAIANELVRHRLASYCLAGTTEVVAYSTKGRSPKRWTLEQLYSWQTDPKRKGRLKLIRLRSVDADGRIVPGAIAKIMYSGVQDVIRVACRSGRVICATPSHRFMTPAGWVRLGDLRVGDRLTANGLPAWANREWIYKKYIEERLTRPQVAKLAGVSDSLLGKAIRAMGIKKPMSLRVNRKGGHGNPGMHSPEGRAQISARMSGSRNPSWKGDRVGPSGGRGRAWKLYDVDVCWGCGERDTQKLERHHYDENPANNARENIYCLCQACHKAFHTGSAVTTVFSDEIVSMDMVGATKTYDVEMLNEPHNFVADGLVVHNCQESTRYVDYAKRGDMEFVEPIGLSPDGRAVWERACQQAEEHYFALRANGVKPEAARDVLPLCLAARIGMTANFREWLHILELRTAPAAHPQMRELMGQIKDMLVGACYEVFGDG